MTALNFLATDNVSLLTNIQIKHVAFRWGGTTRVYEASRLWIDGEEDSDYFVLESARKNNVVDGVWLFFQIESDHFRRISPSGSSGNDKIDILNALADGAVTVEFFPIWSIDNSISYEVQRLPGRVNLIETARTLFSPGIALSLEAIERQNEWPAWARTTRQKG